MFYSGKYWRDSVAAIACILSVFAASPTEASQTDVSIESFKIVGESPMGVEIELVASNDGSLGQVLLGVKAKSRDGAVRSSGFMPVAVPVGQKVHFSASVMRPDAAEAQNTDLLLLSAYRQNEAPFLRTRFAWSHAWPATGARPFSFEPERDVKAQAFVENLLDEDFAALDLLMAEWNNPGERNQSGEWLLAGYPAALRIRSDTNDWSERLDLIRAWRKLNPKSEGAAIAEASYWSDYAWHIRGCRCKEGKTVDPVAMKVFRERMKRGEQALLDSRKYAAHNPLWRQTYLSIAIDAGHDRKFIERLFEEGARAHPQFPPLYATMARYYAPRKGKADWKKVDELVGRALQATSGTDGQENYARIYGQIGDGQDLDVNILEDSLVSWPSMRESFSALTKHYPSAQNLNDFAIFACRAGDREAYLNVSPKLQGRVLPDRWPSNYSFDLCTHRFMQES